MFIKILKNTDAQGRQTDPTVEQGENEIITICDIGITKFKKTKQRN